MPGGRPFVLTEAAFEELRREIRAARQTITNLERNLAHVATRRHEGGFIPAQTIIRTGALVGALAAGSSATVNELELDADGVKVYTGRIHTVYDLKLNVGESIPADTIIDYCATSHGRFKWLTAYCAESDTLPE